MIPHKKIAVTGVLFASIAVLLGAFAAHGLKEVATPESLESFTTGVRYQMYHALALLFVSLVSNQSKHIKRAYLFFVTGVILFSGSIYVLTLASLKQVSLGVFALLTPIGGICLLLGWGFLLFELLKMSQSKSN